MYKKKKNENKSESLSLLKQTSVSVSLVCIYSRMAFSYLVVMITSRYRNKKKVYIQWQLISFSQ